MAINITLKEYATRKSSTVNDVIQFAAEKGVVIPNEPNYLLDDSALKQIDPIFHHRMKYGQLGTTNAIKQPKILGQIDLSSITLYTPSKAKTGEVKKNVMSDEEIHRLRDFGNNHHNKRVYGIINRVMSHGAYISLGEVSGFLYTKDVAWGFVDDLHNYLLEGEKIEVIVLGFDEEKKKLLVGRKQLLEDPLLDVIDNLSVGNEIEGVLKGISKKNRAYIEIDNNAIAEAEIPSGYTYPKGKPISGIITALNKEQHLLEVTITSPLNEIIKPIPKSPKKKTSLEKNIAVVQFFDNRVNMFGRVLTNALGINNEDNTGKLYTLDMSKGEWAPSLTPEDGDWVIFNPGKNFRGRIAKNGDRLSYDKNGLLLAFPYRGKFAKISGVDSKGTRHDHNVICHIINKIFKKTDGRNIVVDAFADYLSAYDGDELSNVISEFLQDTELTKLLISLLPELKAYQNENDNCSNSIKTFGTAIENSIFSKKDIEVFSALPNDFDYTPFFDKTLEVLEASAQEKSVIVTRWLNSHSSILDSLLSRPESLSMDLLYAISIATQNHNVFVDSKKPWNETYRWLKEKTDSIAFSFLISYFADKEQTFIINSNIKNVLDYNEKKNLVSKLLDNPEHHIEVLMHLAEEFVSNDFELICSYIKNKVALNHIYSRISEHLNAHVKENEIQVRDFLSLCREHDIQITDVIGSSEQLTDEMAVEMFAQTADSEYLNIVDDFDSVPQWLNEQDADFVCLFLQSCQKSFIEEEDKEAIADTLTSINEEKFKDAIILLAEDLQYKILQLCPDEYSRNIVARYFASSSLFDLYIGEQWKRCQAEVPYVVFDIESDGNNISEFAFFKEGDIREFSSNDQLPSLGRAISKTPIVVGHNIKQWDLPILKQKGISTSSFIWDTLEIEILLNPCRYAYSLRTEHNAKADTELGNELFWNQLYRLSLDNESCKELQDFLPKEINTILRTLQKPVFSEYFKNSSNAEKQFFQELRPLSNKVYSQITNIVTETEDSNVLVIAPKDLWPRIAQIIPLRFPSVEDDIEYLSINEDRLNEYPMPSHLWNTVLHRFCKVSATPIVANLAQYLRIENEGSDKITFTNSTVSRFVEKSNSRIDCIDIDAFQSKEICSKDYQHIYFIGSERQDRVHKCKEQREWKFSDLLEVGSKLPMQMAATNIAIIPDAELKKLGITKHPLTANVWCERQPNGTFAIYQNYQYQKYRDHFLSHFTGLKHKPIYWETEGEKTDSQNIIQVRTQFRDTYDASVLRVNPVTTRRSNYWAYQFALVDKIHEQNRSLPIVYVVNTLDEYDELFKYATSKGYFIPEEGNGFRKLEYIGNHPDGMIIISKEQFMTGLGSYRTDKPFCYIWDNMDIDRYMVMWDTLPFDGDYEDSSDSDVDEQHKRTTARQCILASWPIFEHYCSLAMANSPETKFYITDPHFEDYSGLAKACKAKNVEYQLWKDDDEFRRILEGASIYFKDNVAETDQLGIDQMKQMILSNWGYSGWRNGQEEIVDYMLSKTGNCVISIPTGGGKSVLFQGPALCRAITSHKLTLVVTPLRALMQDQVEELQTKGFVSNVDYLSGDRMLAETQQIYRRIQSGEIALLYITPERFRVRSFMDVLYQRLRMDGGLEYVVFDEAHCVSQWGQDFRPDYRNAIVRCIELQQTFDIMIAMFSATVTTQVEADFKKFIPDITRLGQSAEEYNPIRNHIGISFAVANSGRKKQGHNDDARVQAIAQYITDNKIDFKESCMLIFCRTHNQCSETAEALNALCEKAPEDSILHKCFDHIDYFHAGLDAEERNEKYCRFKKTRKENGEDVPVAESEHIYILCATKAFGMGMDIPNVHYLVHFTPPSVLEDYLQEVGRAGRDYQENPLERPEFYLSHNELPAVCITSDEDFHKLKDLLVRSQMSWSDLTDCKDKIVAFIKRFRTIEEVMTKPIVVPYGVWTKNDDSDHFMDTTVSRLAFHWLETMGFIKMKYLSPAYYDMTIMSNATDVYFRDERHLNVYNYLKKNAERLDEPSLFSITDMRSAFKMYKMSFPQIMNAILYCHSHNLLSFNEMMRCEIKTRRFCEARYMVNHDDNTFALHVAMEGVRNLLYDCKIGVTQIFDVERREGIYKHLLDDVHYETIKEEKKRRKKVETIIYMPWKNEIQNPPKGAVTVADTFKRNVITRVGPQIFSILRYIPGVEFHVKQVEEKFDFHVKVKNEQWKDFLKYFEEDCFNWIKFVCNQSGAFNWADKLQELEFHHNGNMYGYFEKVLTVLRLLAYIEHSPLISSGIEVLTNKKTECDIDEGTNKDSALYKIRQDFDEQERVKKVRLTAMQIFSLIEREKQGEFIRRYFMCRNYHDYLALAGEYAPEGSNIMSELTEEALIEEEKRFYGDEEKGYLPNEEQIKIYEQPRNAIINVLAGPGSGKTHMLTMRCAKLIYKEYVEPSHLLILAYNRAVVVELKNRLDDLFTKLGMSRIGHHLHVHTFAALAKICMGSRLDGVPTELWENKFLQFLQNNTVEFRGIFPQIEHILVDEFQDMTRDRLLALLEIRNIYPDVKFFTIGDKNQSIYGFDRLPKDNNGNTLTINNPATYAAWLNPDAYYKKLDDELHPTQLTMFTNYRSYQKILDSSAAFIPKLDSSEEGVPTDSKMPVSASTLMAHEPQEPYTVFSDSSSSWTDDLLLYINNVKEQNKIAESNGDEHALIKNIAVFFRTNNEVYRGYADIRSRVPKDVRIRIQGASTCELWREREVYDLIHFLNLRPDTELLLDDDKTARGMKEFLMKKIEDNPSWDAHNIDLAYTIVLNYLESIRSDESIHTYSDLANYIMEVAGKDDGGQIHKIYDRYKEQRILQDDALTVILTTMHKVKGLEFDAVFITSSSLPLPLKPHHAYSIGQELQLDDKADIEEERRLLFVAYTRAKKYLHVYKGQREIAIEEAKHVYLPVNDGTIVYTEREPGLDKYYLSQNVKKEDFPKNKIFADTVKKDDEVIIVADNFGKYYVQHGNDFVGRLSSVNGITRQANAYGIKKLKGFFVSDVSVWTYEDTLKSDRAKGTHFAEEWCEEARKFGIYVVQIAGFGTPTD